MGSFGVEDNSDLLHPETVREIFDTLSPRVDRFRSKNSYYYRMLVELVRTHVAPGRRVLDLGCGHGELLAALKPSVGVGVDISPEMIAQASARHPELSFVVCDVHELALEEKFDFVVLCNTIGFLSDIQSVFRLVRRNTAPHTRLVITHYNYLWEPLLKLADKMGLKTPEPYQNWLSCADVKNLLALEGFEVVHEEQSVILPKYIPFISAFCNRYLARLPVIWRFALVELIVACPLPDPPAARPCSCSVIVPARNERGTIEHIVMRVPEMGLGTEIVFVEGHSHDGTYEEIERVGSLSPKEHPGNETEGGGKSRCGADRFLVCSRGHFNDPRCGPDRPTRRSSQVLRGAGERQGRTGNGVPLGLSDAAGLHAVSQSSCK